MEENLYQCENKSLHCSYELIRNIKKGNMKDGHLKPSTISPVQMNDG